MSSSLFNGEMSFLCNVSSPLETKARKVSFALLACAVLYPSSAVRASISALKMLSSNVFWHVGVLYSFRLAVICSHSRML